MKNIQLLIFCVSVILVYSCAFDEAEELKAMEEIEVVEVIDTTVSDTVVAVNKCDTVSFKKHIEPIFKTNCAIDGCHTAADAPRLNYTSHSVIAQNKNLILAAIKQEGSFKMPLDPNTWKPFKLPASSIELFECWIEKGAKND